MAYIHSDSKMNPGYADPLSAMGGITMGRSDFFVEKTAAGLQYVIPGAERTAPMEPSRQPYAMEQTPAGDQLVIPGAERISNGKYLARLIAQPLTPRRRQLGPHGTPLFGGQSRNSLQHRTFAKFSAK